MSLGTVTAKIELTGTKLYLIHGGLDLRERIQEVLEKEIRPGLQMDGGDVEFVNFDENTGTVSVRLKGACGTCPMSVMTLQLGIERILKDRIPEVKSVISV